MKKYFFITLFLMNIYYPSELYSALTWKIFGNLNEPRQYFGAIPINNTEILIIGGYDNTSGSGKSLSTCEIINLDSGYTTYTQSMNETRFCFVTLITKDSNIIVLSGTKNPSGSVLTSSCELFNTKTRKWSIIGYLIEPRFQFSADFINDHEIIIVGGRQEGNDILDEVEIFDISTGISRQVNNFIYRSGDNVSGYTSNNKFIVFGGRDGGPNSYRSEVIYTYNIANDAWDIFDVFNNQTLFPSALKLSDQRLVISGGSFSESPNNNSRDIYIENNGGISLAGIMFYPRHWHNMAQWNSDSVLIIGGFDSNVNNIFECEWFNTQTRITSRGPILNYGRSMFKVVSLPSKQNINFRRILAIGGKDSNSRSIESIEILEPEISSYPPIITQSSSDCDNFYFTVSDSNLINKVELTGFKNNNVKVSTIESLPASVVHVVVSLIDKKQNGYFTVTCTSSKTGLSVELSDTIFSKIYFLKLISPIKNGTIDIGDTINDSVKCVDVELKNDGYQDIIIDSARLVKNYEFYIPSGQLPITIPKGQRGTLRICFESSVIGTFNDSLILKDDCDSLIFPVVGRCIVNKPPYSSDGRLDCENFYFTVTDPNFIDRIELTGFNQNVTITIIETLPDSVVHVVVSLIDRKKTGFFEVTCYSNKTGLSDRIMGKIDGKSSVLKVLTPLDSGVIIVGITDSGVLKCIKVLIHNTDSEEFVLDYARLDTNIEFSIPQAQLPLTIPPGDTAELVICYLPSSLEEQSDTLTLGDLCDTLRIPVIAQGDTAFYSGKGRCGTLLNGKTLTPGSMIKVGYPVPNPGSNEVSIIVSGSNGLPGRCYLIDLRGELIQEAEKVNSVSGTDEDEKKSIEYNINLNNVSTGVYFIIVETIEGKRIFPYFVMK
ncbi:MAG: hypothetical protein EPN82_05175 [Bacteroidetes bacterium]|nr:MAG: hypothetical protein EPN82_05175 [Bacteroidota bacterium]